MGSIQPSEMTHVSMRKRILDIRVLDLIYLVVFNLLFFEMWIQNSFGFTYIDEIVSLMLLGVALLRLAYNHRSSISVGSDILASLFLITSMCLSGFLGNYLFKLQPIQNAIYIDFFTCIKFPIATLSSFIILRDNRHIYKLVLAESKFLATVMLVCAVLNLFFEFGMGWEPYARFGLRSSFMFVLGHPTTVVACCTSLLILLMRERRNNKVWIAAVLTVAALTLRSKGFVLIAVSVFLYFTFGEKLSVFHVMFALLIAAFVGYDQFVNYFSTDGAARNELLRRSLEIANDYRPLGTGFATYGAAVTSDPSTYSKLYYIYGISNVWGLTPDNARFLSDTFWPTIIAQFGWIGFGLYVASLICLFKFIYRNGSAARLCSLICFAYLLISSTSESSFFHPMAILLAFSLGVALSGLSTDGVAASEVES